MAGAPHADLFRPIVLLTGFGPFLNHPVNASWESVKLLPKEDLERRHRIELVTLEIPVTYENVDEFVPALWETHEPKLVIHVGVSSVAKELTIETIAYRKGYVKKDYLNRCPANNVCTADGASKIKTQLNVERICELVNSKQIGTTVATSCDAGRYLCEYIYYTSLSVDPRRVIFVHVPDANVVPLEQTARGLEHILDLCLEEIREQDQQDEKNNLDVGSNRVYGTSS